MLILAPIGNDAAVTARLLIEAGIFATPCRNMTELLHEMHLGCAALILAEEGLGENSTQVLSEALHNQPSWSDIPIIIITGFSTESSAIEAVNLGVSGYLTKPVGIPQVLAAAAKALGHPAA